MAYTSSMLRFMSLYISPNNPLLKECSMVILLSGNKSLVAFIKTNCKLLI